MVSIVHIYNTFTRKMKNILHTLPGSPSLLQDSWIFWEHLLAFLQVKVFSQNNWEHCLVPFVNYSAFLKFLGTLASLFLCKGLSQNMQEDCLVPFWQLFSIPKVFLNWSTPKTLGIWHTMILPICNKVILYIVLWWGMQLQLKSIDCVAQEHSKIKYNHLCFVIWFYFMFNMYTIY